MLKVLELFSGYGTTSHALKQLNIPFELIGYSDIDKYANQCFQQNHGGKELGDVKNIRTEDLKDFDLLTGGFPCQSFSVAGKGLGELDTRGTLFNEIIRIAEAKQPKYILLENVKGLTFKKHKDTFNKIISELERIGYNVYWKVLNSKDFNIPQNRERIWFVCFRKDLEHNFKWPHVQPATIFLKDILEAEVEEKYFIKQEQVNKLKVPPISEDIHPTIDANYYKGYSNQRRMLKVCAVLTPERANKRQNGRRFKNNGEPSFTISVQDRHGILINDRIRKLTPRESFRLMGFIDDNINLSGLSDTQKYKLAGNGQDVNIVKLLYTEIINTGSLTKE